jgi:serine/threonine-protein kinase
MARQKKRFPPELALFIAREVANGLGYAHRRTGIDGTSLDLVHCDISPPNVLVSFEGETKIIDFGIAKSALRATATDPKMGFGKFGYMAPEQLIRGGVVDFRTDIYAAGVVLYELLTGTRLYELGADGAPDYRALARQVSRGEHDLPSDTDPMLAPFDELVARALRPSPADRYQTAADFRDAIQTALVAVSPTMSSDQLGSYLRAVFAGEMNAHQELVERVSHMHLDDFREQLTTASVATISFALANMPLVAPADRATPVPGTNLRPVAGVVMTGPVGTGTVELTDLDMVGKDRTTAIRRRRSRNVVIAAVLATLAVAVVIAFAASGGSSAERTKRPADPTPAPAPAPSPVASMLPSEPAKQVTTVTPILPEPEPEIIIEPDPEPAPRPAAVVKKATPIRKPDKVVKADKPDKTKVIAPPTPDADADAVLAKFKAVSREYKQFKKAYGSRLDSDWTDLATQAQYAKSSPDKLQQLDRKLDRFRSLMKAQK